MTYRTRWSIRNEDQRLRTLISRFVYYRCPRTGAVWTSSTADRSTKRRWTGLLSHHHPAVRREIQFRVRWTWGKKKGKINTDIYIEGERKTVKSLFLSLQPSLSSPLAERKRSLRPRALGKRIQEDSRASKSEVCPRSLGLSHHGENFSSVPTFLSPHLLVHSLPCSSRQSRRTHL